MKDSRILYQRVLPGGGYVHVEEEPGPDEVHRAHVAVERRGDPTRRAGHEPPVIAVAEGPTAQSAVRQLMEIANDNVEIARALLRLRPDGLAKF